MALVSRFPVASGVDCGISMVQFVAVAIVTALALVVPGAILITRRVAGLCKAAV
jgi:hypothetical protein